MEHQRIDEGIKRGPKRRSVPKRRDPETGQVQAIPLDLDPHHVLQLYLSERTTSQIAKQFGLSRKSLVAWLRKTVPEKWYDVQATRAFCRKEDGDEGLYTASDAISLSRARELVRSGHLDLQALDRAYAPKSEVSMSVTVDLGDKLRRARERVIEAPAPPELLQANIPIESGTSK